MPIPVQITLIISIVVLTCVAFFCSVVRNQQRIEETAAMTEHNQSVLEIMRFLESNPKFQKIIGFDEEKP